MRVPRSALRPLSADLQPEIEAGRIAYVAAAAKVAEVLECSTSATEGHVLLAPMESNVIPLPHHIHALSRAISGDRVRYLLADEVGLGKTIEAGLVMRELAARAGAPNSGCLSWKVSPPSGWRKCRPISMNSSSLFWVTTSAHCNAWLQGRPAGAQFGRCSIRSSSRSTPSSPWTSDAAGRRKGSPNTTAAGSRI